MNASADMAVSLGIIERVLSTLTPDILAQLRQSLVRNYFNREPAQREVIISHAEQQIRDTHNIRNIDWSGVSVPVPAEICQALWDFYVNETVLQSIKQHRQ